MIARGILACPTGSEYNAEELKGTKF